MQLRRSQLPKNFDGQGLAATGVAREVRRIFLGLSCKSQIMFLFHSGRSTSIPLAAPMRESKILTDAAKHQRRVHISGKWRRGKETGCSYVDVTSVDSPR